MRGSAWLFPLSFIFSGCGPAPLALHVPTCAVAPSGGTHVDLDPIAVLPDARPVVPGTPFEGPGPAVVLTNGMRTELSARPLEGGEAGGYGARCRLDRFALRTKSESALGRTMAILYVDLACDVRRGADKAIVWRGALRGRGAAAAEVGLFSSDDRLLQGLADRVMSDVSRELASDLALRVLGLRAKSSVRVFANEEAERQGGGTDDTALGKTALTESAEAARAAAASLRDADPLTRASAWNVVAMAAAPDQEWPAGIDDRIDEDAFVRFYQYKAFARHGTRATLSSAKRALRREPQALLEEFLRDTLASDGLAVRGGKNASTDTNGTLPKP